MIRESTGFLEALTAPTPSIRRKKKPTTPTATGPPALLEPVSSVPDDVPVSQSRQGGIKLLDAILPAPHQFQPNAQGHNSLKVERRSDSPDEKKINRVKEFNVSVQGKRELMIVEMLLIVVFLCHFFFTVL